MRLHGEPNALLFAKTGSRVTPNTWSLRVHLGAVSGLAAELRAVDDLSVLGRLRSAVRRVRDHLGDVGRIARGLVPDRVRVGAIVRSVGDALRPRTDLAIENLALRQQVAVLKKERSRPRTTGFDRAFWVGLRRCWSKWDRALAIVQPETVVRWHRQGFKAFWRKKSARGPGRPRKDPEIRKAILQIKKENPDWGAPKVHGELLKLGLKVSERTVSRYLPKTPPTPDAIERWKAFIRNHRGDIAAMDFFTVPTISFAVLYVFFVIHHDRRKILHVAVTSQPSPRCVPSN